MAHAIIKCGFVFDVAVNNPSFLNESLDTAYYRMNTSKKMLSMRINLVYKCLQVFPQTLPKYRPSHLTVKSSYSCNNTKLSLVYGSMAVFISHSHVCKFLFALYNTAPWCLKKDT